MASQPPQPERPEQTPVDNPVPSPVDPQPPTPTDPGEGTTVPDRDKNGLHQHS
jgi:hypothetical protein